MELLFIPAAAGYIWTVVTLSRENSRLARWVYARCSVLDALTGKHGSSTPETSKTNNESDG